MLGELLSLPLTEIDTDIHQDFLRHKDIKMRKH